MELRAEDLRVSYMNRSGHPVEVLDVARLSFAPGSHTCLVGESGSGKTTLLNVLAGIVLPQRGHVALGETKLTQLPEQERDRFRAEHFGYVFQAFNLLQGLTVLENVALAYAVGSRASVATARERARELLKRVGLESLEGALPATLSSGEQQRVAIARAVSNRPAVLLADEPTASLDPRNADSVLELLQGVARDAGSTLVLVTHDERVQRRFKSVVSLADLTT